MQLVKELSPEDLVETAQPEPQSLTDKKNNILICGPSGSGKSSSLRNLDPERTIILSTENRVLPFPGGKKFKKQKYIKCFTEYERVLKSAMTAPGVDVVVTDSLTSLAEFAYIELVRHVEKKGDNVRHAWSQYKDRMHDVLLASKQAADRYIVFIGIDTITQDEQQRIIRTTDIQGSLKGKIEKEFDLCLWTKVVEGDATSEQAYRHVFVTNSDLSNKAKSPMGMFNDHHIDNDLAAVIARCESYDDD